MRIEHASKSFKGYRRSGSSLSFADEVNVNLVRLSLRLPVEVVRISCMGADTNTACYNKDLHVSRAGAEIPLMLQHYWWGEEALIKNGLPVTVLRNNFFMNHLLKTDTENIDKEGWSAVLARFTAHTGDAF